MNESELLIIFLLMGQSSPLVEEGEIITIPESHWSMDNSFNEEVTVTADVDPTCALIQPTTAETFRRLNGIMPFFDSFKNNSALLQKLTSEALMMFDGDDLKDQEASFYIMLLVPLAFLNDFNDIWCLFEKLYQSLRIFKISDATDKRVSLKTLQNLEIVHNKVRKFIEMLPQQKEKEHPVIATAEQRNAKDWVVRQSPLIYGH